jgi:hypothetical protein
MNPTEVQSHLAGAAYPATGEELAALAEDNGAPAQLVDRLRDLGEAEVDGADELMEELDELDDPDDEL